MSMFARAIAAAAALATILFGSAEAADINLIVAKESGGLMATSTGQSSNVTLDYRTTGCVEIVKAEPCFVLNQQMMAMTVSASAPGDCRVETNGREIATVYCRASDYASVGIVKNNGGDVTLGSGPHNHTQCVPVRVTVAIRSMGVVDSRNGCSNQTIICAPNAPSAVTANIGDTVTGPCLVERK